MLLVQLYSGNEQGKISAFLSSEGERYFQKLCQMFSTTKIFWSKLLQIPFFRSAMGRVNENFKQLLANVGGRQEDGKGSPLFAAKGEKDAFKICATSSQK